MSDSFSRRIRRERERQLVVAATLARCRAEGCTCEPDITVPSSFGPGVVRVTTVTHDNDCPHFLDPKEAGPLAERINAGEFDVDDR